MYERLFCPCDAILFIASFCDSMPAHERLLLFVLFGITHSRMTFGSRTASIPYLPRTLADALLGQDAAVYCLGTYTGTVSDAELRAITADYTIEFARVLHSSSPNAAFSFLSGNGADPTGRSQLAFARYKGQGREGITRGRIPARLPFPARIYLPCAAAKGTELQLPAVTRGLSRVSTAVSEPGNSG
jgi:hypothetical protein